MSSRSSPSPKYLYPNWQPLYEAALIETDLAKIAEKVQTAEDVIQKRLEALPDGADCQREREAIENALRALGVVKRMPA